MTGIYLPTGLHKGLHIEHHAGESAGHEGSGGNKWLWHTTEAPWFSVDSMASVLIGKRACPELLVGGRHGVSHPIVIQFMSLDEAGRALQNDSSDGFATNLANCVQTEICWTAAHASELTEWHYKAFANLVRLVNEELSKKQEIPPKLARRFSNTTRFTDAEFVKAEGHCGHMHAPDNDHTDPGTGFKGSRLMHLLDHMPRGGYDL